MRHTKVCFFSQVYFLCRALFIISLFIFARLFSSFYLLYVAFFFRGFQTETKPGVAQSYFVKTTRQ